MEETDIKFKGIANLYGHKALGVFQKSHVAVAGVGGVGSWIAESLVRSGVGKISMIDMDEVCLSNANRQIQALYSTVGKPKVEVLKERCVDINPDVTIENHFEFVTPDNVEKFLSQDVKVFVDATDSVKAKCAIAKTCADRKVPLVMVGGAGGKSDPTQIVVQDLNKVVNDYLLRQVKRLLKRDYGFSTSSKTLKIDAVFSKELPKYPGENGEVCETKNTESATKLDCGGGLGASTMVTGTFGFFAAHRVLQRLVL